MVGINVHLNFQKNMCGLGLATNARRARQQQVGHIRTRDQQHQPDRHHLSHMKFLEEQIVEIDDDIKATIHEMGMDREWDLVQTVPGLHKNSHLGFFAY